jgi:hypothetical protein
MTSAGIKALLAQHGILPPIEASVVPGDVVPATAFAKNGA